MPLKSYLLILLFMLPVSAAANPDKVPGYDLGIVAKPADNGLRVLAITPGGAAERVGLRVGDQVTSVNGGALNRDNPVLALQQAVDASSGKARFELVREGTVLTLEGQFPPTPATPMGCGYVTANAVAPESQGVFRAFITQIDGRSTPLSFVPNRYRLPAGRHVITVAERINRMRFNKSQLVQITKMKKPAAAKVYKAFVVNVQPDTSHRIGARLLRDKLDTNGIRDNAYWEPVTWSSVPEKCD